MHFLRMLLICTWQFGKFVHKNRTVHCQWTLPIRCFFRSCEILIINLNKKKNEFFGCKWANRVGLLFYYYLSPEPIRYSHGRKKQIMTKSHCKEFYLRILQIHNRIRFACFIVVVAVAVPLLLLFSAHSICSFPSTCIERLKLQHHDSTS